MGSVAMADAAGRLTVWAPIGGGFGGKLTDDSNAYARNLGPLRSRRFQHTCVHVYRA
jgi:hypothetical protein